MKARTVLNVYIRLLNLVEDSASKESVVFWTHSFINMDEEEEVGKKLA